MPSVLPRISNELLADFSQPPRCATAFFSGMPRISRMASASTSSATERVLENGALNTAMPRSRAAARSTWLVPMQKQPTAARRWARADAHEMRVGDLGQQLVVGQGAGQALDLAVARRAKHLDGRGVDALQQQEADLVLVDGGLGAGLDGLGRGGGGGVHS